MTAEAAVVIPALVLLVAGLLWGLMAAVTRIQCVDAARAGARAAARGETGDGVVRAVRSAAPPGARLKVTKDGELVRVAVRARTVGPGPLTVELRSEAVAMDEAGAENPGEVGGAGTGRSHDRTPASPGSPDGPEQDDARQTEKTEKDARQTEEKEE
ncbi:TadE family type IV pilus minor pilin [Streptomyces reniochalinae]|uniref:TadE-like domain-containing protein n=1 Tax=Streptomyces reniochalinae TaxID=2250578 RepID=A0A367E857_9ACTN|nr:TadE family type IV pilus minor pilin [Streptomyces reniochalinae]RCG14201.1 hypothetical protein DQ392_29185 [Streptomyces reniochalinae]